MANPQILRYNEITSHLFVYDAATKQVIELDNEGDVVNKYGSEGRGPGEFLRVNNIFLTNDYLYVVDRTQFRISRFTLDGKLDESMNYGKGDPQALPPAAPLPLEPRAKNINNQPAVTAQGDILLSNFHPDIDFNSLYSLVDWNGEHKADIGDIPEGSAFSVDFEKYQTSIDKREVPAYYRSYTFPVINQVNEEEISLVYSALSKISKYDKKGNELWEKNITNTPERGSLINLYYSVSEKVMKKGKPGWRVKLVQYTSGIADPDENLYLVLGKNYFGDPSNHLWIHEFNPKGKLIDRYKLISEDVNIPSIFAIDFEGRRIFVPTKEADIRVYPF